MFAIDEKIRTQVGIVAGGEVSIDEPEDELDPDDQPISLS
jgi:hypothetical protein